MSLLERLRRRRVPIYLLVGVLTAAGIGAARRLPSAIFPEVTFPIVKVIAESGEEPAARMMPTVTRPLEEAILRVPGVVSVRSTTSRGSTEISARFAWGSDMQVGITRVRGEAQRVLPALPAKTTIDVEWMNPAIFPIQGYALTSSTRSQAELRALAEYTLRPALIRIPGVSEVQIQGGRKREFQVHLDRQALLGRDLAVSDVIDAVKKTNQVRSAGLTERNHELYLTLVSGRVHDVAALERIAVPVARGVPATLGELGTVAVGDEVSWIRTTADGHPAVLVNIIRQPSASTVAIARGIEQLFRDRPDLLPSGVTWSNFYDQARFVSDSVAGVRDAILIGVSLAALVLLVFLRRLGVAAITVATIPVTIAVVGLALAGLGKTINLMSLAGVAAAIGLIVDDAIVVIENIHRHEEEGRDDPSSSGAAEIAGALIGSSLSTTVILVPFAMLGGIVGAFFKPLALTMALCLVVSFFIALVVVPPSMALLSRRRHRVGGQASWLARLGRRLRPRRLEDAARRGSRLLGGGFGRALRLFVGNRVVAVVTTLCFLGAAFLLQRRLGTDFLPAMDEGSIILDYWTPPGSALSDTDAMLDEVEKIIMSLPDVESYSRRTGTQLGFFITEPNRGDYVIKLKQRGSRRPIEAVIGELRRRIAATEPAIHTDFGQLLEDNIGDLTGGEPQPIDIKIFGDDQALLEKRARHIASLVGRVRGVEDVFDGITVAGPALRIDIDPAAAARAGVTTEDLHAAVEPAVIGTVVDQIRVGQRVYDLRVFARGPGDLGHLLIRTPAPTSALLPLDRLASISTGEPETEIDRENLRSYVGVTARLSGRSLGGALTEIRRRIAAEVSLGRGESIRYGGLYQQQQSSFRGLLYVLVGGLLLVAVVVLFEFNDWRAPLIVALVALSSLAGVFGLLWVTGMTLNISSFVAAIMMVGIAGENAVFVIHEGRLALRRGEAVERAWSHAGRRRLRPVAMTVAATGLALAPLALAIGQGAQLMQPLAIGVIGGFLASGPLVLLVLPGLYRTLDPRGRLGRGGQR